MRKAVDKLMKVISTLLGILLMIAVLLVLAGIIGCFVLAGQSPEVAKRYHRWAKWAQQEWHITLDHTGQ